MPVISTEAKRSGETCGVFEAAQTQRLATVLFGPVSAAAHGGSKGSVFGVLVMTAVLVLAWAGFLKPEWSKNKVSIFELAVITGICILAIFWQVKKLLAH